MRRRRVPVLLLLVVLLLAGLLPGTAFGQTAGAPGSDLPDGWSVRFDAGRVVLAYELAAPLPIRDARPEFREGEVLLGYPMEREGRLELVVTPQVAAALESPSAWLSGRRLDGPTPVEPETTEFIVPAQGDRVLSGLADPGVRGPFATVTLDYELAGLTIDGYSVPLEVVAEVVAPVGIARPKPLVLFLHGRHATCYSLTPEPFVTLEWPCPPGTLPIPSHRGYRYVADLLASQGYITVSISANGINAQDGYTADGGASARSQLIRHHLAQWVAWSTAGGDPWSDRFQGLVDLDRVVLVGHSRGGEGIERAAVDAIPSDGYRIVGLAPIGPTAFGRQVAAGIVTAVIHPYCDGDVSDLQGQQYIDQSRDLIASRALRSAVMVFGANHNFFNSEWTPGTAVAPSDDDWLWAGPRDDRFCGPDGALRLTPAEQRAVGATYIVALVQAAVRRDPIATLLLDGSPTRAASAGRAIVLTHALGGHRRLLYRPRLVDDMRTNGMSARVCRGYLNAGGGLMPGCSAADWARLPHWLPMYGMESLPGPLALDLEWRRTGGTVRIPLSEVRDLGSATDLDLRLAVDSASLPVELRVRLVDESGAVALLPPADPVVPLRGRQSPLAKVWAQTLRFSLAGVTGIDRSAIVAVQIESVSTRGRAWLLDIFGRRSGATTSEEIELPRVSVPMVDVAEGGPGTRVEMLPLEIRGAVVAPASLWVSVTGSNGYQDSFRLVIPPGTTQAGVPITVEGNDQFDPSPVQYTVGLRAISRVTTGEYTGGLTVIDDEPVPTLTFVATRDRVAEGGTLVFTATLSSPVPVDLWYSLNLGEVSGRPTLFTNDVTEGFLLQWSGWIPDPAQPLWMSVYPSLHIPAGETVATFEIPTTVDAEVEDREVITVTLQGWEDRIVPVPITVRGTVRDS